MVRDEKYMLFGFFLLLIGILAALWGISSGGWILLPPSALVLFIGVLYLRAGRGKSHRDVMLLPSHARRLGARSSSANIPGTDDF